MAAGGNSENRHAPLERRDVYRVVPKKKHPLYRLRASIELITLVDRINGHWRRV